jgi:multidrug resistance efflux pump
MSNEKSTVKKTKKKWKGRLALVLILTVLLAGGAYFGYQYYQDNVNYLSTDNARITTTLANVTPDIPSILERFMVYEGRRVTHNEILGWVYGGESFRAPFDGVVVRAYARQGQAVSPMEPLAVIADLDNLHIQANIEETHIARVQIGQAVTVTIDALGRESFAGYVAGIGRVTDNEISGNAMFFNTGGNFTKVTQLIPVRIHLTDEVDLASMIGLNVSVRIALYSEPIEIAVPPRPGLSVDRLMAWGTVESAERRTIYANTGFIVQDVFVRVGDTVTEGQILAVLDTEDIELNIAQLRAEFGMSQQHSQAAIQDSLRLYNEARANLAGNRNVHVLSAETALENARVGLEAAQRVYNIALRESRDGTCPQVILAETTVRDARIALDRARFDFEHFRFQWGISQYEVRQYQNAVTTAEHNYNDARTNRDNILAAQRRTLEQLEIALNDARSAHQQAQGLLNAARIAAGQEIDALQASLTSASMLANLEAQEIALLILERQLENAVIRAPIGGVITAVYTSEGAVGAGALFLIEDTNNLRITARVREYDISRVGAGMGVTIRSDATGDAVYAGTVSRVHPVAVHSSVVEFEVVIDVTTAETDLLIGMTARVGIDLQT